MSYLSPCLAIMGKESWLICCTHGCRNQSCNESSLILSASNAGSTKHAPIPPSSPSTAPFRSEEHTSELRSLMRNSYAVFCLKKKKQLTDTVTNNTTSHSNIHINHTN